MGQKYNEKSEKIKEQHLLHAKSGVCTETVANHGDKEVKIKEMLASYSAIISNWWWGALPYITLHL